MKINSTVSGISGEVLTPASRAPGVLLGSGYLELTKPRVTLMVVLTTIAGFYLGSGESASFLALFNTVLGTGVLAAGTAVLNQFMERNADSKMRRTAVRPIPAGRIAASDALLFGMILVAFGALYLLLTTNFLTAALGWFTSAVYLLVYTPMKTRSPKCTVVGAVPGAIPPLMGWTAATGEVTLTSLVLFGLLFTWQFPHFLAIAWLYKEDYRRGGFCMLPLDDPAGRKTGRQILGFSLLLLSLSIFPTVTGMSDLWYLAGAVLLGAGFAGYAFRMALQPSNRAARHLIRASVSYLPLLLLLMTIGKV